MKNTCLWQGLNCCIGCLPGSQSLGGQMSSGHRWGGGCRVGTPWEANRAVMNCAVWGGSTTHANYPSIQFSHVQKQLLRLSCSSSSATGVTTSRRWYEELKPDLDLGLLQGNSACESPCCGGAGTALPTVLQICHHSESLTIKAECPPCQGNNSRM